MFDSQFSRQDDRAGAFRPAAGIPVLPAFAAGALLLTDRGERLAETLRPGDRLLTRDNGFQPVFWAGQRMGRDTGPVAAVTIAPGALGEGSPARKMTVAPDQRLLIAGAFAHDLGLAEEALARAADLVGFAGIRQVPAAPRHLVQIALASHEILCANGCWTESLPLSPTVLRTLPASAQDRLVECALVPGNLPARPNADRRVLRRLAVA